MGKKKNILFFFTDQQRADTCGCYGSDNNLTPCLDDLAKEGMCYDFACSPQPVCGPARAILQTGQYATKNGCYRNDIPIQNDDPTLLAKLMKQGGYTTNYIGKWHLSGTLTEPITQELRCGYEDYWLAADTLEFTSSAYEGYVYDNQNKKVAFEHQYRVDFLTDKLIDFIHAQANESTPFFMFTSFLEPHHQNTEHRYMGPKEYQVKMEDVSIPNDLKALGCLETDWQSNIVDYYGCVKRLDESLGRVIAALKETGQYEDTIIIFTSDHGCHFKTRNAEYKRSCHESSIHVPLIISGGGFAMQGRVPNPVSLVDIPATILSLAGVNVPESYDGHSLLEEKFDDSIFIQISESEVARALRTEKFKYAVTAPHKDGWRDSYSDVYVEKYLYDLQNDPDELRNLIDNVEYEQEKMHLKQCLLEKIKQVESRSPSIVSLTTSTQS